MSPLKQPLQQLYQGANVPGGYYYLYHYLIFQLIELSLDQNTNPSFWFPKTDPPSPAPVCKMDAWDKSWGGQLAALPWTQAWALAMVLNPQATNRTATHDGGLSGSEAAGHWGRSI